MSVPVTRQTTIKVAGNVINVDDIWIAVKRGSKLEIITHDNQKYMSNKDVSDEQFNRIVQLINLNTYFTNNPQK